MGGGVKRKHRYLALYFTHLNIVQAVKVQSRIQHMQFCREISYVASCTHNEGSQKLTNNGEREGGGGVTISPKNDDVVCEQALWPVAFP